MLTLQVQVLAPKILQGFIAAVNDFYTAQLAFKLFDDDAYQNVAVSGHVKQMRVVSSSIFVVLLPSSLAAVLFGRVFLQCDCHNQDLLQFYRNRSSCRRVVLLAMEWQFVRGDFLRVLPSNTY